jgi:plastocyanin
MTRLLLLVFFACAALASCGGDSSGVSMTEDFKFDPESIMVAAGTNVTFSNTTNEPHSVTAYEESLPDDADYFSSGGLQSESRARDEVGEALLDPGEEFEVTLETPGTYRYFCIPHEEQGMRGTIVVE